MKYRAAFLVCLAFASTTSATAAEPPVPPTSMIGRPDSSAQRVLISAIEADAPVRRGGWRLADLAAGPAPDGVAAKVGRSALEMKGTAQIAGAKGDYAIVADPAGQFRMLGLWLYLPPKANVSFVGLQVYDVEGEAMMATMTADWEGWRWVEFDLSSPSFRQPYRQKDKNGKVDLPLKSISAIWFARDVGPTSVVIDGLVGTIEALAATARVSVDVAGGAVAEPGKPLATQLVLTNYDAKPAEVSVEDSVQQDPAYFNGEPPDPDFGSDHAVGAKSWTVADGKTIEENSLTDDKDWTGASTDWKNNHFAEVFQFVDLGKERKITHLAYRAGDANWVHKVDVDASTDGKTYSPIKSLQGVDLYKKWGRQPLPLGEPVAARFLRLRYHSDGKKEHVVRMPVALHVYDGVADETSEIPSVGKVVAKGTTAAQIAPRSFAVVNLGDAAPLPTGSYLVAIKVRSGERTELTYRHTLVMPDRLKGVSAVSRFGINASDPNLAPLLSRLGIGWVRFENMKWPMTSPKPDEFRFDGTVGPWHVDHDAIFAAYRAEGLNVLPFLFQTAAYASSAPANVAEHRKYAYPPKDNATFADFCFQTAARYGQTKQPENLLKSPDKKSGLNEINVFEIWNEQNLTDPAWGPWVSTNERYMEMFRAAAEAVKRADPQAKVTHGGWAGIEAEIVNRLIAHTYADGKKPLDFVDVLNVHYYSGRTPPELATIDTNVQRNAGDQKKGLTYEEHLRRLVAWRDQHKPGLPIWLTETGYDTAGPWGTNEQIQAARLPRCVMMALAAGVEKVFVYREKGSTPSLHAASGLIRDDGTLKPSYFTYAQLIRNLDGVTEGKRLAHPDDNVRVYLWKKASGEFVVSAWAVNGTGTLGLTGGKCVQTDSFGARTTLEATRQTPLTIFPVYLTGFTDPAALTNAWASGKVD